MDSDGTQDARGTHAHPVPRPAEPTDVPAEPRHGPATPYDAAATRYDGEATPYEAPAVPPRPTRAPDLPPSAAQPGFAPHASHPRDPSHPRAPVADWLAEPRPDVEPGIWRYGYYLPKETRQSQRLAPVTIVGFVVPLVAGLVLWSLWRSRSGRLWRSAPVQRSAAKVRSSRSAPRSVRPLAK